MSLPLWVVPAEDEPAHGMLIRVAERNGIRSAGQIRALTGLTARELRNGIGIEHLASILKCDAEIIQRSTPVISDSALTIRGERISRREMKASVRRLCPTCVKEYAHQRFWFDLAFVSTCPTHARNLIHTCSCGQDLSWTDVRISRCRHCEDGDATNVAEPAVNLEVMDIDRWILSRLGVGKPVQCAILDAAPLSQALGLIGQVGILEVGGFRENWTEANELGLSVAEARARGFKILRDGGLDEVLDKVYGEFLASSSGKPRTINYVYGWFSRWWSTIGSENFPEEIAGIVQAHASRHRVMIRCHPNVLGPARCAIGTRSGLPSKFEH